MTATHVRRPPALVALVVLLLTGLLPTAASAAANPPVTHAELVGETPRTGAPYVDNGKVKDLAQIGDRVFVGGNFTSVLTGRGGTRIDQGKLFAYDASTGILDQSFDPSIDGEVRSLLPSPDGRWLYVGGQFYTVDGATERNLFRIDPITGVVDHSWATTTNGPISTMAFQGDDTLWVGGSFQFANTLRRNAIAAFATDSSAVRDYQVWADNVSSPTTIVPALRVTPDGGTLVIATLGADVGTRIENGNLLDGQRKYGLAMVDISGGPGTSVLLPFRAPRYDLQSNSTWMVQDMDMAPDGSYVVVVHGGGDRNDSYNDTAARFDLSQRDDGNAEAVWRARLFDSLFSVAVTGTAVYVGGHFCFVPGEDAPGPFPARDGNDHSCYRPSFSSTPSGGKYDGTVVRYQLAALDPSTGLAMPRWAPGADGNKGVLALTATEDGLLVGHDGSTIGRLDVGRHALLPFRSTSTPVNLARDADARMSTTWVEDQVPYNANRAVDGNIRNGSDIGWLAHTLDERDPFVEIDLGSVRNIGTVTVFNRTDCCSDRSSLMGVIVSDTPFDGDATIEEAAFTPGATYVYDTAQTPNEWTVTFNRTARYVRVQRNCDCILNLREIEVIEADAPLPDDTTPPTVTIAQPTEGQVVPDPVTVSGTATDDHDVARVRVALRNLDTGDYLADDGTWSPGWKIHHTELFGTTTPEVTWSVDLPAGLPEASYRVFAYARDLVGNDATYATLTFSVGTPPPPDTANPTIEVFLPVADTAVTNPVVVTGRATDDTEVVGVEVAVRNMDTGLFLAQDGTFVPGWTRYPVNVPITPGAIVDWQHDLPADLPLGVYRVFPKSVDVAGKIATTFREFRVTDVDPADDAAPPTISVTAPTSGATVANPVQLAGDATDDLKVVSVEVAIRNMDTGEYLAADGTFVPGWTRYPVTGGGQGTDVTWTHDMPDGLPAGSYRAFPSVVDVAGNRTSGFVPFTIG